MEKDVLETMMHQLVTYEKILKPEWREKVEVANKAWIETAKKLQEAHQSAEEAIKRKREVEFVFTVLQDQLKAEADVIPASTQKHTLHVLTDRWNRTSDDLAQCDATLSETDNINQQMEQTVACLMQENTELLGQLTHAKQRKRVQEQAIIASRKRIQELNKRESILRASIHDRSQTLKSRQPFHFSYNKDLFRTINQHAHENHGDILQWLTNEVQALTSSNNEISLQNSLEETIVRETEAAIKEQLNSLEVLLDEFESDQLNTWSEHQGEKEWTAEARMLWQECVCLKNKNNHIAKNIEDLKTYGSK